MTRLVFRCEHTYASGFRLAAEFETNDGVTALFGPSGSGKTTILLLIAGLLRPSAGAIQFDGRVLTDTAARIHLAPELRNVGVVFQDDLLFPHLSVRENLEYARRRSAGARRDLGHVAEILEIADLLDRPPRTLSGGQRKRTALARAILRNPDLLLLDEPFTALDDPLKDRVVAYLKRALSECGIPTLLVAHDAGPVRELASRTILVANGAVTAAGATASLLPA